MIEFAGVIALLGTPTRGGWHLAPPPHGEPVPTSRDLPLPVKGHQATGGERIGWVEHLATVREYVVARGFLDNTPAGRDYAGTLRLGLTRMVMDGETTGWTYPEERLVGVPQTAVRCTQWRVTGASVEVAPTWDLPRTQVEIRGLV